MTSALTPIRSRSDAFFQSIAAVLIALPIALLASTSVDAQATGRADGMRFVPDVENQYSLLTELPEPLGFNLGGSPDPSSCKHYQAMVRVDGVDGTPFFLMTRSGNLPSSVPSGILCDDSPGETDHGHLIVFRMVSRPKHGERLRSNRLRKGMVVNGTPPPTGDKASIYFTVVGGNPRDPDPARRPGVVVRDGDGNPPQRVYRHPGGMQVVGRMLAVALESPSDASLPGTQIMFFDVSNPENPVFRSQYTPINGAGQTRASAGTVAITPLPSGRYLMMTTGGANTTWYYYRSTLNDLSSPNLSWDYVGSHPAPPGLLDPHQTLQFLRQGNIDGDLFLAGARGHWNRDDHDRLDLFLIKGDTPELIPGEGLQLTIVSRGDRISPYPTTGGNRLANLAAASTFHVTPTGELLFYATQHDNEGPDGSVTVGEWRHIDMARTDSPTRMPTVNVNGPFQVDEGGRVSLTGSFNAPSERAWIQLFHERDFGGVDFHSQSVVVDYDGRALDDFDDFRFLEALPGYPRLNDRARSLRWYAPAGCSIVAIDHGDGQTNLPETLTLVGDNRVHSEPDLLRVRNDANTDDIDSEIDAIEFRSGCDLYYNKPFELAWDLDRNGSFETSGTLAFFFATHLDGPAELDIPAQARHSYFGGGPTAQTTARVSVRNVRPQVTDFRLDGVTGTLPTDQQPNTLPTVLMGLPVKVDATFTDAGVRDHQSASLSWGDGSVEAHTAFATFTDAFGGVTGSLSHSHRYATAGARRIELTVMDDDRGAGTFARGVLVQSPAEWIEMVLTRLDVLIEVTSDETARQHLEQARLALAGNPKRTDDGAVGMIASGNYAAAIDLVNASIASLGASGLPGATALVHPLEQVVTSLVALLRMSGA
jgi:hypothetical protein